MKMMSAGNKIVKPQENKLEEYNLPKESCISGWYIDPTICDDILDYYKTNNHLIRPGVFSNYDTPNGETFSKDYGVMKYSGKMDVDAKNSNDMLIQAAAYDKPWNRYRDQLQRVLNHYCMKFDEVNNLKRFQVMEGYNIQHYPVGGGLKKWHSENDGWGSNVNRSFVFMTYLNDVEDGGTDFKFQKLTTPAKKGLTLIWPAYWTHTHKSQISTTSEKYIVTGWYSFYDK